MEKRMRNKWSGLWLLLVLPWLTSCVTRPEIRLDMGQGPPIVYTPPAAEPPPVEIRQEEFVEALTALVLHMPLALSPPPQRQGRVVLASWGGAQDKAQAGRRYGRVLGNNGMRVLLLLATAAIAGQTSFLTKGPKLPGFRQAAAASTTRTGVRLEAAGQVETVALGAQELVVGLAPPAVAAMAMGPGGGTPPVKPGSLTMRPTSEAGTSRVGRWMSEAEYKAMLESGQVQAPLNGAGAIHVTVPPNASAFKPPPQSTHFVEFDVPTGQLRVHDTVNGWGRVFGPGSLEARAAAAKRLAVPTEMPPATNIRVTIP